MRPGFAYYTDLQRNLNFPLFALKEQSNLDFSLFTIHFSPFTLLLWFEVSSHLSPLTTYLSHCLSACKVTHSRRNVQRFLGRLTPRTPPTAPRRASSRGGGSKKMAFFLGRHGEKPYICTRPPAPRRGGRREHLIDNLRATCARNPENTHPMTSIRPCLLAGAMAIFTPPTGRRRRAAWR